MDHQLPVIKIRYYSDHLGLGDYSDSEMKMYDEKGNFMFETSHKIKYRGNSSFQYSKKSFTLKFDDERPFFFMDKSSYWKLNAEYIDKTFMRNKLSYDLFRQFTEGNFAPMVDYVVLYENEKYQGLYSISEGVDEFRLRLSTDNGGAVLFKEPPLHFPPSEHSKRFKDFQRYSKENERYANYSQKAKKKLIKRSYFNQRFPSVQKTDKKSVIIDLTEFIFNSTDEEFQDEIFSKHFDLQNVIDWHLLLLITNNGDGIKKNNYIYRQAYGKPFLYCPWDFDHSFGREGDGELIKEDICDIESHELFERLMKLNPEGYRQKLYKKFMRLKENDVLSVKHLHEMIDENAKKIRPEIEANEALWPLDAIRHFKGSNFEKEVQLMKDWIEKRIPRIEQYLTDNRPEFCFGPPIKPLAYGPPVQIVPSPVCGSAVEPYYED